MTHIDTWNVEHFCRQIGEICKQTGESMVIIVRSDGSFQMTNPNPVDEPLPADKDERQDEES